MDPGRAELVAVLRDACELVRRPGNDFSWSSWEDADAAVMELSAYVTTIEAGWLPPRLQMGVLFAPTGPMQEVAQSSGWQQEFLAIAARFDAAEANVYESTSR